MKASVPPAHDAGTSSRSANPTDEPVAPTEVVTELDGSVTEYYDIPIRPSVWDRNTGKVLRLRQMEGRSVDELGTLVALCKELFVEHHARIRFGPCIQGAVFELELREKPGRLSLLDGYLTVEIPPGPAHFHLCVAATRGLGRRRTPDALARQRQCRRAAFYRGLGSDGCTPGSWGIRLWNGANEQMLTFFLPSPFLSDALRRIDPDYTRLGLWNELRARYLGERVPQPLPTDRPRRGHA